MDDSDSGVGSFSYSAGIPRRELLLRVSAGGLLAALVAAVPHLAAAQESTPVDATTDTGLPPGVGFAELTRVTPGDLPPGPVTVALTRTTLEPGTDLPIASYPFSELLYMEAGTAVCPGDAPRWFIPAGGSAQEIGSEDVTLNPGDAIYIPANVPDGIRNEGTEQAVALAIDFYPLDPMATPVAT